MRSKKRSFILLQGPIGPFFKDLADHLMREGHMTTKINFFGGDDAFFPEGKPFTDKASQWPSFFINECKHNSATDVIMFSDRRELHEMAIEAISAASLNIRIWVFEEGYFRPNWITMDQYGINYRSHLPQSKDGLMTATNGQYIAQTAQEKMAPWIPSAKPMFVKYYGFATFKQGKYKHFNYHRRESWADELLGWTTMSMRESLTGGTAEDLNIFRNGEGDHFLLTLQLEGDFQIREYSPKYKTMSDVIKRVCHSFRKNASDSDRLVIKAHPYEYNWAAQNKLVQKLRKEYDLGDRLLFINKCPMGDVLKGCKGMITVNSTSAFSAMEHQVPVKALGQAFWNYAPLTNVDVPLGEFWKTPKQPDAEIFKLFKSHTIEKTQFNGCYYTPNGRRRAVASVLPALTSWEQDVADLQYAPMRRASEKRSEKLQRLNSLRGGRVKVNIAL